MATAMIYSSYPDFNKTPKEFLATIMETLIQWPEAIIYQIADKRTGIQTREMFPPNVAQITKMAQEIEERMGLVPPPTRPSGYARLNGPLSQKQIGDVERRGSSEERRAFVQATIREYGLQKMPDYENPSWCPPAPTMDISDFPPTNSAWAQDARPISVRFVPPVKL